MHHLLQFSFNHFEIMQSSSIGYTHFGLCLFDNQLIVEVDNQVIVEVFAKKTLFEFMFCPGQISVTIKDRDTGFFVV